MPVLILVEDNFTIFFLGTSISVRVVGVQPFGRKIVRLEAYPLTILTVG